MLLFLSSQTLIVSGFASSRFFEHPEKLAGCGAPQRAQLAGVSIVFLQSLVIWLPAHLSHLECGCSIGYDGKSPGICNIAQA
ncbi:hypothetical protein NPIL_640591 [Nephila pilipes]|uniref:Uncharacterized protein n=1 Tax=Nephila pilipes TaxID=299642 RepID=A0A8X6PJX2_NEPPI|nr:hypothetical protein NPIL_640591 [Nephila pilipes]